MRPRTICILFLLLCAVAAWDAAERREGPASEFSFYAMGANVSGAFYGEVPDGMAAKIRQAVHSLEGSISWRLASSDISRVNAGSGSFVPVPSALASALRTLLALAHESGGAFDPTISPLSSLWRFDDGAVSAPSPEAVKKAAALVGYERVEISGDSVRLALGQRLELGAAGKGMACDAIAREAAGVKGLNGMVASVGGSVAVLGSKNGKPFRVAVRDPFGAPDETMGVLSLSDCFVSTSGSYERYFLSGDVRFHHILNPTTGYPALSNLLSATVVCGSGLQSDALATACFVLPPEKARKLLRDHGAAAIIITNDHAVYVSQELTASFDLSGRDTKEGTYTDRKTRYHIENFERWE